MMKMPFEDRAAAALPHGLTLEDRRQLTISGVEDVERFDETIIVLSTAQGALTVQGTGLHIERLSLDGGDLKVEGLVDSLSYEDRAEQSGGLFARLFR
jgi:sporulation protein YabP